jgi:lactosylceramide 4-alpha-galactosyltransferase
MAKSLKIFLFVSIVASIFALAYLNEYIQVILNNLVTVKVVEIGIQSQELPKYDIYFIETNISRTVLNYKQMCAIESAARHNPNARVNLIAIQEKNNFEYLTRYYKNVQIKVVEVNELFKDTPLEKWSIEKLTKINELTRIVHLSDILRMAVLYKYGGLYLDLDMFTLASYDDLIGYDSICMYRSDGIMDFNNAYLTGVKGSNFYLECLKKLAASYKPHGWFDNGPTLLHDIAVKYCNIGESGDIRQLLVGDKSRFNAKRQFKFNFTAEVNNTCGVYLLPAYVAHPYHWIQVKNLFQKEGTVDVNRFLYSRAVHTTNALTRNMHIKSDDESLIEFIFRFNCPHAFEKILESEL